VKRLGGLQICLSFGLLLQVRDKKPRFQAL